MTLAKHGVFCYTSFYKNSFGFCRKTSWFLARPPSLAQILFSSSRVWCVFVSWVLQFHCRAQAQVLSSLLTRSALSRSWRLGGQTHSWLSAEPLPSAWWLDQSLSFSQTVRMQFGTAACRNPPGPATSIWCCDCVQLEMRSCFDLGSSVLFMRKRGGIKRTRLLFHCFGQLANRST